MNKWAMDGNSVEKWPSGGGIAYDTPHAVRHRSIHPIGRTDDYREANRRNRFKFKLHGRRDPDLNAPSPTKKGKGK